jgi:hypothetical protein
MRGRVKTKRGIEAPAMMVSTRHGREGEGRPKEAACADQKSPVTGPFTCGIYQTT